MYLFVLRFYLLFLFIFGLNCGFPSTIFAGQNPGWSEKMYKLKDVLSQLLLDIVSDERFNSPKNFKKIEERAGLLAQLSHEMKSPPDADPSIILISGLFREQTGRAHLALKSGQRQYGRSILNSVTEYCIACHTRNQQGPQFFGQEKNPGLQSLSKPDLARYFVATRQFDSAFNELQQIIADPKIAHSRQIEWEKAIRHALSISVRVKKDPDQSLIIVEKALASPRIPLFLQEDLGEWKKSILTWKEEVPRKIGTAEGLFSETLRLVSVARSQQKYPVDRSAYVSYLRASSTIHEYLGLNPKGPKSTEAYYLAGTVYEALQDPSLWTLHELYYEACVYKEPHSEIATQCYRKYEESLYLGYSGSSGVSIPYEVMKKLKQLKEMAQPISATLQ